MEAILDRGLGIACCRVLAKVRHVVMVYSWYLIVV